MHKCEQGTFLTKERGNHIIDREGTTVKELNATINLIKEDLLKTDCHLHELSNYAIFEMEKVKYVLMWLPAQNYENPNTVHF